MDAGGQRRYGAGIIVSGYRKEDGSWRGNLHETGSCGILDGS